MIFYLIFPLVQFRVEHTEDNSFFLKVKFYGNMFIDKRLVAVT